MTESEAIARIRDHFEVHNDNRPHPYLDEAVEMAIQALEKQKCLITVRMSGLYIVLYAMEWWKDGETQKKKL